MILFDHNDDGNMDLLAGSGIENLTHLYFYENSGDWTFIQLTGINNPFDGILCNTTDIGISDCNPQIEDMDGGYKYFYKPFFIFYIFC